MPGRVNVNVHVCVGGGEHGMAFLLLQLEEPLGTLARQLRGTPGKLGCSGQSLAGA